MKPRSTDASSTSKNAASGWAFAADSSTPEPISPTDATSLRPRNSLEAATYGSREEAASRHSAQGPVRARLEELPTFFRRMEIKPVAEIAAEPPQGWGAVGRPDVLQGPRPSPGQLRLEVERKVSRWDSQEQLIKHTQDYVADKLAAAYAAAARGDAPALIVVVVGQVGDATDCMMVEMAAMQAVKENGKGRPTLLLPRPPAEVEELVNGPVADLRAALPTTTSSEADIVAIEQRLIDEITRPGGAPPTEASLNKGKALAAAHLGFDIGGFQDHSRHLTDLQNRLKGAPGPVVLAMERSGVPQLLEDLEGKAQVICLASVDHNFTNEEDPYRFHRHVDLLRNADARLYRGTSGLRSGHKNYFEFAFMAGIEMKGDA